MPFEVFQKGTHAANDRLKARIYSNRTQISLSRGLYGRMGKPEAVLMLFDEDSQRIGIKPAPLTDQNSYTVHIQGTTPIIVCRAFIKSYDLQPGNLKVNFINNDGMIVFS